MARICAASCEMFMAGEATRPKVSLSTQVHRATLPMTLGCAATHAACPPSGPALISRAPLAWLEKLEIKAPGEVPDRLPAMNSMVWGVLPVALSSYTAETT